MPLPSEAQARQLADLTAEGTRCDQRIAERTQELTEEQQKVDVEFCQLQEQQQALTEKLKQLNAAIPTAMVMRDLEKPRATFVLAQGAYDQPGEEVATGVPALFPALPAEAALDRLGFARWLVSRDHPLTARVIVNRLWAEIFGRGLVTTLEDFGTRARPLRTRNCSTGSRSSSWTQGGTCSTSCD